MLLSTSSSSSSSPQVQFWDDSSRPLLATIFAQQSSPHRLIAHCEQTQQRIRLLKPCDSGTFSMAAIGLHRHASRIPTEQKTTGAVFWGQRQSKPTRQKRTRAPLPLPPITHYIVCAGTTHHTTAVVFRSYMYGTQQ